MINPEQLTEKIQNTIQSSLERMMDENSNLLVETVKTKMLENINKAFDECMGREEFEKFCKYLISRNITIFMGEDKNVLTVCFYDEMIFYKIKEIINDYYDFLLQDKL